MWVKKFTRPDNIQQDELMRGQAMITNPVFPRVINSFIALPTGKGFLDFYFQDDEWDRLMKKIVKRFFTKINLSSHRKYYKKICKKLLISVKPFSGNLFLLSDRELLIFYRRFVESENSFWVFLYTPWAVNEIIEPYFAKEVKD